MPDTNPFSRFVQSPPEVKPGTTTQPFSREEARGLFGRVGSFQGESQYDEGLTFGMNQMRNRAENQPWYDELGNAVAKTVPGIGLGILENAGYMGELLSGDQDYTNALTEFASGARGQLDEALPLYRKNPQDITSFSDSAWWIQHGQGLVESIGEFYVTGGITGAGLGKASKLLSNALKGTSAYKTATIASNVGATLGTAATLAYTEGAMSGAQIYKEVYDNEMSMHGNIKLANEKASDAASHTVKLNTMINTGLNITSVLPLLKTFDNLYTTSRLGLSRKAGEALSDYSARLTQLATSGVPEASVRAALAGEAVQEGLEETVNVFAEQEGRIRGGLVKPTSTDPLARYFQTAFSEEGALNFALGAIGGVAQTAGLNYLPYRSYTDEQGNTKRVNNVQLNRLQENETAKRYISTLQEDIKYLTTKQKELSTAVEAEDKIAVNRAKEDLFNVAMLKSIREGVAEEFSEDLKKIAQLDNTFVSVKAVNGNAGNPDGRTEAMRAGFADSPQDNSFRQTALKKVEDLKTLGDEYQMVKQTFADPYVANEVFRNRLNVYSLQSHVEKLSEENNKLTNEALKLSTDPFANDAISSQANINALNAIIKGLETQKNKTPLENRMLGNLKNTLMIEDKLQQDRLQLTPSLEAQLQENKGLQQQLTLIRVPVIAYGEELRQQKYEYNQLLANVKQTEVNLLKQKDKLSKQMQEDEDNRKIEKEKAQEDKDLKTAQQKQQAQAAQQAAAKPQPVTGAPPAPDSSPTATAEQAAAPVAEKEAVQPPEPVEENPTIVVPKPTDVDMTYPGKTANDSKEEKKNTEDDVKAVNILDNLSSRVNKIAYRARENDTDPINKDFLVLHDPKVNVGTEIVLKLATESPYYKQDQPNDKQPIGVYLQDKLVGYIHLPKDTEAQLIDVRNKIIADGPITTTIASKDLGIINYSDTKRKTSSAMPTILGVAIGRDNKLAIGVKADYKSDKLKNNPAKIRDGVTYAIVTTPNDTEFAIPLDTSKVAESVVGSVITAFKIYLNSDSLIEEDNKTLDEIFQKFDIDVRTPAGFEKYFKTFFYNYNLTDPDRIQAANADKSDKRWVQFSGNGIRYMKSGGGITVEGQLQAKEVGRNSPDETVDRLLDDLEDHLSKMYYNVDLEQLQANAPVDLPIFKLDEAKDILTYTTYSKPTYTEHVKSITETTVIGSKVNEDYTTYFVSPKIYFNTGFMSQQAQQNYGVPINKTEEKAILAPEEEEKKEKKTKKAMKSMAKPLPNSKVDPNQITNDIAKERKDFCK